MIINAVLKTRPALLDSIEDGSFLKELSKQWTVYTTATKRMCDTLLYLDRSFIPDNKLPVILILEIYFEDLNALIFRRFKNSVLSFFAKKWSSIRWFMRILKPPLKRWILLIEIRLSKNGIFSLISINFWWYLNGDELRKVWKGIYKMLSDVRMEEEWAKCAPQFQEVFI